MGDPVSTIGDHYRRQASREVWAEIDELRRANGDMQATISALKAEIARLSAELAEMTSQKEGNGHD